MPYREYVRRGWQVRILTFDRGSLPLLPEGISAVRFPHPVLLPLLPWTHRSLGRWADVIKTNQSDGAHYYTRAAHVWNKPIVLRCGYVKGEYLETVDGMTTATARYQTKEARAFRAATHCLLPTEDLSTWVRDRYQLPADKITLVPNFVDTAVFTPLAGIDKKPMSVVTVGRLSPVKRFDLLLRACSGILGCRLTIIGEGEERGRLHDLATELGVELSLPGNLENVKLPAELQKHRVFAITSQREGHPKSLIEAMACGMPCVGVDAIGIRNVISNDLNGLLVGASVEQVRDGLSLLLQNEALAHSLGGAAADFTSEAYSFERCMATELSVVGRP
ncbi:glycosyltransferase family 4 protein [Pelobacter propionicus]|uniref:glycosyltransferase family 4 protein n=1 Tax=Pelobacter propionicus TaxID=29543 RepID=UPI0018DDFAF5|nr:glycosyltransferase family 4 protein [Pelobacter propionicus]